MFSLTMKTCSDFSESGLAAAARRKLRLGGFESYALEAELDCDFTR
jgi:hypothetical protein